jgi:Gti1/Pac2 family transcription factor
VKQTYSVYLNESEGNKRKWHLSKYLSSPFPNPCLIFLAAYFTQATVDSLGTVDDIPVLKDLVVPEGLFRSSRRTKTRSSRAAAAAAAHAADASPATPAPASSSGRPGKQIASVAGPSSTVSRTHPQVMTQSAAPPQNQGLPATSAYPQELFNPKSPPYSGLPPNPAPPPPPPVQQPDAYARIYTGESYASPQPPEGYHVSPSPHVQPHVTPFEYNWPAPPTPVTDHACQSGYPYPVVVDSQKGDSTFQHSPVQSPQLYVYGSGFQASLQYRTVSPALSHAPSQFSASSQSQSSSESDSPAPGPVALRTPVFSPDRLSVVLPTDGETKYEIHGIREPDSTIDSKVGLASLESLNRYHPYRREPLDDRVVQRFLRPF